MINLCKFKATDGKGEVSGILFRPEGAQLLLVFAHGAGGGMRTRFMELMSEKLAERRIASFRYHFPYMENRGKRPDPKPILLETVRSAVQAATTLAPELPILAGGKSMGGRMTSNAGAESSLPGVKGLIFFGFPLHPPGLPSVERAEHLARVNVPMLFLQGTRDTFADLELLKPVCGNLGARATLYIVEGADHSFHLPKSLGRTDDDVLGELAEVVEKWGMER